MATKKWIAGAIRRPGALTAKAKRAGKSVAGYCASLGEGASTQTKRQCALFHTLRHMARKRKKLVVSAGFLMNLFKKAKPFDYEQWVEELAAQEE